MYTVNCLKITGVSSFCLMTNFNVFSARVEMFLQFSHTLYYCQSISFDSLGFLVIEILSLSLLV